MRLRRPIRKRTARAPTDKTPVEVAEPSTCSPASWTDPLCSIFNVFELCGSTSNVDGNKQKTTDDSGGSSRGSSRGNASPDRAAALPPALPPSARKKRDRNTKENVQSPRQKSVAAVTTGAASKKINSTGKSSNKNVSKAPSTNAKTGPGAKGVSGKYFAGRKRQLSSNTSLQLTLEGPSEPVSSVSDNSSTGSENGSSNDSSKSDDSSDSSDTDSSGSFSYTTDSEAETASSESGSVGGSSTDSAIVDKDLIALLSKVRQPAPASPPSLQETAETCSPLPQPQPQKQEQELPAGPPRKLRQRRFLGGHRGTSNLESAPAPKRRGKGGRRASAGKQT
jgi:hypothetical protein